MGCYTHPPGSLRRRGRRLPTGRPELVVSTPAFKRARQLTASDWDREEACVVTRLDAKKDRPFAAGPRIREGLAHLLRRGHALARNVEDHVTIAKALRGSRAIRIDLRYDNTVGTGTCHLAGRSQRKAELRHIS